MHSDNSWFGKSNLKIVIIFLISFSFIYLDSSNQRLFSKTKSFINDAIAYASYAITFPIKKIIETPAAVKTISKLKDEHEKIAILENKIQELSLQNEFLKKDFKKFENFLKEEKPFEFEAIQAKVISSISNIFANSFIVNKGSVDGVKEGSPIVKNNNLIGQVSEVNNSSSRAIFLTDINSRVPVVIGEQMYQAILAGNPTKKNQLKLEFLPKNYQFQNGDMIYTSEIDGILKRGIVIGSLLIDSQEDKKGQDNYSIELNYGEKQIDYVSILIN